MVVLIKHETRRLYMELELDEKKLKSPKMKLVCLSLWAVSLFSIMLVVACNWGVTVRLCRRMFCWPSLHWALGKDGKGVDRHGHGEFVRVRGLPRGRG